MKHALSAALITGLMALSSEAILQVDLPASLFPENHGPAAASMLTMGNVNPWPATALAGPDGWPLAYHLMFNYDENAPNPPVVTSITVEAGICSKTWTPTPFSLIYQIGPTFPVDWNISGTVAPDNEPFVLCTCWPDDPDCLPPECGLGAETLPFGTVPAGIPTTLEFTITNVGGQVLSGTVTEGEGDTDVFDIIAGASYSLTAGQSQSVTVQFLSDIPGSYSCDLNAGADCGSLSVSGTIDEPAVCAVDPTSLDFGTGFVNTPVDRTFTITNEGGSILAGEVTESCGTYSILSGGAYSLTAGQSQTVTVRFQGANAGTFTCLLDVGGDCDDVFCTGTLDAPPACAIEPAALDFGVNQADTPVTRTFTVTNAGGGTLAGTVSEACAAYTILSGADYSLGAGESQTVTVSFQAATIGDYPCTLDTGGDCADLACTAAVEGPPICSVEPGVLNWGTIAPGVAEEQSFQVTNVGGGVLEGEFVEDCPEFTIVSGASFSLGAGQNQTVTVSFLGVEEGTVACPVYSTACPNTIMPCVANVVDPASCALSTTTLDFGETWVGAPVTLSFSVTNNGQGYIYGTVTESCPAFSIISGADFDIGPGESDMVSVRLLATEAGAFDCTLTVGAICGTVACEGLVEPAPVCNVNVTDLDFGTTPTDVPVTRDFTISNDGGGILSGTVTETCEEFSILAGAAYSLDAGASQTVTVQLLASETGPLSCTLSLGNSCGTLPCTGLVDNSPACLVEPAALDFGLQLPDTPVDQEFTITNVGGGTLSGSVALTCGGQFALTSSADYSLTNGQSQTFTVDFVSSVPGQFACDLDLGGACADLPLSGTVELAPECEVSTADLNFGTLLPDTPAVLTFTITNVGGHTLAGAVSESCPDFAITSGADYSLGAGQSQTVTVLFQAADAGTYNCALDTGGACADVACEAVVDLAAACAVTPTTLDFGTLAPNTPDTETFTITNTGGGTLSGLVTESCDGFSIVSGASYSLGAGQSQTVTVQFQAAAAGPYTCSINTGGSCDDVACSATVELAPECEISVPVLDFGTYLQGSAGTAGFMITNVGGGTLSGTVAVDCDGFAITSGATYSLTAGQSQNVVVGFTASATGNHSCTIDTGTDCEDLVAQVSVVGVAIASGPESGCGAVDNLGHLPNSTTGFAPDWEANLVGLTLANGVDNPVTVSILVDNAVVWSGAVGGASWAANSVPDFDLEDYFDEDIQLHFEASDGHSVWNNDGAVCSWDLSFLEVAERARPTVFALLKPMPNPFNPVTRLVLQVPAPDHVALRVMDLQGRSVETLFDGDLPMGTHEFSWRPGLQASGTYFVVAKGLNDTQVQRVLYLK